MAAAEKTDHGPIVLDLPLKGERTYLQSADILSVLIVQFSLTGAVKLEFRQMIHHPIYLLAGAPDSANRAGKFSFQDDGVWHIYGIYIDDSLTIARRIPNNEAEILAASHRENDAAWGPIDKPGNFIDTIVALNKAVVGSHMGVGRKAIFTTISLDAIPDAGEIGIALIKKMGTRIYVSDVIWNKARIGSLTFMTV